MAKNDLILLDAIIENRVKEGFPSNKKDEVFEYLAYEQALKEYDLSSDEILSGSVDGKDDGGIDAIFIFVNGHLINDLKSVMLPKSDVSLEVFFFTCKHKNSFKQDPINSMFTSLEELLDFSKDERIFNGEYNTDVLQKRKLFYNTFVKLASIIKTFSIRVIFASRGDAKNELAENVVARGKQIETLCKEYFSECTSKFIFWGAEEILKAYRRKADYSLELVFQENLTHGKQMVVLAKISDFYKFITYEDGKIRRYLFDSNVRAFMGFNAVNEDIYNTLISPRLDEDFWWLNNGITILCSKAIAIGKCVSIENVQIVNGLQTSECIHKYFLDEQIEDDNRVVLIKILPCESTQIADDITRSTNNQTAIMSGSLRATDKLQEDIEEIMVKENLYYERRVNYYSNQGIPAMKIFSPLYLAKGYMALVKKKPYNAIALKQRFMRKDASYREIFSERDDLRVWPIIAKIMRMTDEYIDIIRIKRTGERFKRDVRYQLAFLTVSRMMGSFAYSFDELMRFDIQSYTLSEVTRTWNDMFSILDMNSASSKFRKKMSALNIIKEVAEMEGIENFNAISGQKSKESSKELKNKVLECLPDQPWPKGVQMSVSKKIGISEDKASYAIGELIKEGVVKP